MRHSTSHQSVSTTSVFGRLELFSPSYRKSQLLAMIRVLCVVDLACTSGPTCVGAQAAEPEQKVVENLHASGRVNTSRIDALYKGGAH